MSNSLDDFPIGDPPSPPSRAGGRYRPAPGLVLSVTILFFAEMGLSVLLGAMSLLEATVFVDQIAEEEIVDGPSGAFYLGYGCLGVLYLPVHLACVVMFCIWAYRANTNSRALGARDMEFTPGWCVGWFFVPIANLLKPYQAIREIHLASDPEADAFNWKHSSMSASVGWWWGFWIIGNIMANAEMRMNFSGDAQLMVAGAWMGVLSGVLSIPTALLAIHVVRDIHHRQERKAENPLSAEVEFMDEQFPGSHESPAEADGGRLEECPWCGRRVAQTSDGRCPACDRPI